MVQVSFEGSEHVSSLIIVSYDGLVTHTILVDLAVGLHRGVVGQVSGEDGDVCLRKGLIAFISIGRGLIFKIQILVCLYGQLFPM